MVDIFKLADNCTIISDIKDGDTFPVGGSRLNPDKKLYIQADFSAVPLFFDKVDNAFTKNDLSGLRNWAKTANENVAPDTLVKLFLLEKITEKYLKDRITDNLFERQNLYSNAKTAKLSNLVNEGQIACVELSLLILEALKRQDIEANLINGAYIEKKPTEDGEDYWEAHTYLIIDDGDSNAIILYDPAHPLAVNMGKIEAEQFPSMYVVDREHYAQWTEQATQRPCSLVLTEEISGKQKLFGAHEHDINFFRSQVLSAPQTQSSTDQNYDI